MRIFLVRHGKPEKSNVWLGKMDVHLLEEEKERLRKLASEFKNKEIKRIYSSPMKRAFETAEVIAKEIGVEVFISEEFTAMDHGNATGKTIEEIKKMEKIEGGETLEEVRERSIKKLKEIVEEDSNVIIVTHNRVIKEILGWIVDASFEGCLRFKTDYGKYTEIEYNSGKFRILKINC